MDNINTVKTTLLTIVGALGSGLINFLGGWSEDLTTLLIFMGIDFLLGLLIAFAFHKSNKSETGALSSYSAWKGLCKKGVTLLIILVANRLDIMLDMNYIRTAVIIAFCVNELISIVENIGIMGVPLPSVIKNAIEILQKKSESEEK